MSKTMIMAGRRNAGSKVMEIRVEKKGTVPNLRTFKVQGWVRDQSASPVLVGHDMRSREKRVPIYKSARVAMRVETIKSVSGLDAAKQYARTYQIRPFQWMQVDPSDNAEVVDVVIRVEEA